MKIKNILAGMLLFAVAFCVYGASPSSQRAAENVNTLPFSSSAYRVGERLTYNISFANFNLAGHAELFLAGRDAFGGREGFELRAHVETTNIVGTALFPLNNDYVSTVDPATGVPFRAQQLVRQGGLAASDLTPAAASSQSPDKSFADVALAGGAYDPLSALYRLRGMPMTEGGVYPLRVSYYGGVYETEARVKGKEMLQTTVGSFNAIVAEVRVAKNPQLDRYRLRFYFSDDAHHIPLLITARHAAGEIRAEIASVSLMTPVKPKETPPGDRPVIAVSPPPSGPTTPNAANRPFPGSLPFGAGEQLNYQVYFGSMGQPAAELTYQVRARSTYFGRDGILLTALAQTTNAGRSLIVINDQVSSYVDPVTLLPFRTELRIEEGKRRASFLLNYEQDRGLAVTAQGQRIEIPVATHDLLSVLYALRSFNLAPLKRNSVSLLLNNRPRTLIINSLKREAIELNKQKINAIQLSLMTDDPEGNKYDLRVWVGDDRRRLPLRISAQNTPLGPIRADLAVIPVISQ